MKYLALFLVLPLLVAILLAGCCCGRQYSVVDYFKQEHPYEFKQYIYIYPISLDTYYYLEGGRHADVDSLVRILEKSATDPWLKGYAKKEHQEANDDWQRTIEEYTRLEKNAADGGLVCQFKWSDGTNTEMGLLVLKNRNVVTRDVWVTEHNASSMNTRNH